jgi:hypothetical protein
MKHEPAGANDIPVESACLERQFGAACAVFATSRQQDQVLQTQFASQCDKIANGLLGGRNREIGVEGDVSRAGSRHGRTPGSPIFPVAQRLQPLLDPQAGFTVFTDDQYG